MLKKQTPSLTVSIHSIAKDRTPMAEDILTERLLHKLFLLLQTPATWQAWQIGVGLSTIAFIIELIWLPFGPIAFIAAGLYLFFALGDWLLLWGLPQAGLSFGPIGSQLFFITYPRFGVALASTLLAYIWGTPVGIGTFMAMQSIGTLLYLWGFLREPFALGTTSKTMRLSHWPSEAHPLRLLHLSDLHVERLTKREANLLELIKQAQPDIIVITGDYLNLSYIDDPAARTEVRKVLANLSAPYGVYATLGSPPVDPRETTPSLFAGLNIQLLRDELAIITLPDGRRLSLLGIDCEHNLEADAAVLKRLIALTPPDAPCVMLYHSPELMLQALAYPIDLYLCGHTHGGQIRLPFYGAILTSSALGKRYEMGLYTEQGTTMYISRGIGLEGLCAPRMRLLCKPEVILWTLLGAG